MKKISINVFCYLIVRMLQHNTIAFTSKKTFARTTAVILLYVFQNMCFLFWCFFYYYYYYFKSSQDKDVQIQTVWNNNYRLLKHVPSFAFRAILLALLRYVLTILRLLRSHTVRRSTLPVWQPILYTVTTAAYIKRKLKSILPHAWVNQFIFKVCQRSNVNLKVSSVTKTRVH